MKVKRVNITMDSDLHRAAVAHAYKNEKSDFSNYVRDLVLRDLRQWGMMQRSIVDTATADATEPTDATGAKGKTSEASASKVAQLAEKVRKGVETPRARPAESRKADRG